MAAISAINTRKMRYTGAAMEAFKTSKVQAPRNLVKSQDIVSSKSYIDYTENPSDRFWIERELQLSPPRITDGLRHQIGTYPLTSDLALWVRQAAVNYQPNDQVQELVGPFSLDLHEFFESERKKSSGFHDLNLLELTYQIALEVGAEILLVADATDDPIDIQIKLHSSEAARDDHLAPWGKLLTGLECNPPIIAQFPVYLMMCQSFTFDQASTTEDYVYSALSGIDWAKGKGVFSQKFQAFEKLA